MSLNSCYDRIKIDRHKITLDGDAQEVVIKANTGIFSIYVDCDDLGNGSYNRYPKDSFYWYKHIIETNGEEL